PGRSARGGHPLLPCRQTSRPHRRRTDRRDRKRAVDPDAIAARGGARSELRLLPLSTPRLDRYLWVVFQALPRYLPAKSLQPSVCPAYCPPPVWPHLRPKTPRRRFCRDVCGLAYAPVGVATALSRLAGLAQASLRGCLDEEYPRESAAAHGRGAVH